MSVVIRNGNATKAQARKVNRLDRRLARKFRNTEIALRYTPGGLLFIEWVDGPGCGEVTRHCPPGFRVMTARTISLKTIMTVTTAWWLRGEWHQPTQADFGPGAVDAAGPDVAAFAELLREILTPQFGWAPQGSDCAGTVASMAAMAFYRLEHFAPAVAAAAGMDLEELRAAACLTSPWLNGPGRMRTMVSLDGPGWAVTDAAGTVKKGRWDRRSHALSEGLAHMYPKSGHMVTCVSA